MFGIFRRRRAQKAIDAVCKEVVDEGLPSALGKDAVAGYLATLGLARFLYMHLFFGRHRFVKVSDAGRPGRDRQLFATLVAVMFSSFAPLMGIDRNQVAIVLGWKFRLIPKLWHEHLIGLTEALGDEAGDLSFQSNSILSLMKKVSSTGLGDEGDVAIVDGFVFNTVYLAYVADAQKQFKQLRDAIGD